MHTKKSIAEPKNYRGVHLTPQIAKVVERSIGSLFIPWMAQHCFGEHQYAYSKDRSHRDALAVNVCCWLLLFEEGKLAALYCSDVSGAFDRVSRTRLVDKIRSSGLPANVASFLESWLEDRMSTVIVAGAHSVDEVLANSVFQGTVLGPPLWNLFYADARYVVRGEGYTETVFADDFNCWTAFCNDVKEFDGVISLSRCQSRLHAWGGANQVVFDPLKEAFVLLRRFRALGENFKLLGITFDPQLLMHVGAREVAVEAGWRLRSILRARWHFTTPELVRLYKSLVLSYIESGVSGYYHGAPSVLACIDRVQKRFLREVGLTETEALLDFRLAPLVSRRDMAILGFLHRVNLGLVSTQVRDLFPPVPPPPVRPGRFGARLHNKRLLDRVDRRSSDQFRRSIFGMVNCYNSLPQFVVDKPSVASFQGALQDALKNQASAGAEGWPEIFSVGRMYASLIRFQGFFRR